MFRWIYQISPMNWMIIFFVMIMMNFIFLNNNLSYFILTNIWKSKLKLLYKNNMMYVK